MTFCYTSVENQLQYPRTYVTGKCKIATTHSTQPIIEAMMYVTNATLNRDFPVSRKRPRQCLSHRLIILSIQPNRQDEEWNPEGHEKHCLKRPTIQVNHIPPKSFKNELYSE